MLQLCSYRASTKHWSTLNIESVPTHLKHARTRTQIFTKRSIFRTGTVYHLLLTLLSILNLSALQFQELSNHCIFPADLSETSFQLIRRLQNVELEASMATVATPLEFQAALDSGAQHIVIEQHLDFTQFQATTNLNWTAAFHVPEGIKSIQVCTSYASSQLELMLNYFSVLGPVLCVLKFPYRSEGKICWQGMRFQAWV